MIDFSLDMRIGRLEESAKSIDSCQSAHSSQTDMNRHYLPCQISACQRTSVPNDLASSWLKYSTTTTTTTTTTFSLLYFSSTTVYNMRKIIKRKVKSPNSGQLEWCLFTKYK